MQTESPGNQTRQVTYTVSQVARMLGVTRRRVSSLYEGGRLRGAYMVGDEDAPPQARLMLIPKGAEILPPPEKQVSKPRGVIEAYVNAARSRGVKATVPPPGWYYEEINPQAKPEG